MTDTTPQNRPPRVGWKQCALPFPENYTPIQMAVADLHQALTAASGVIPKHFALFVRDADNDRTAGSVLLLSPAAAKYVARLPGQWADADDIDEHGWGLLYGDARDQGELGLRSPALFD